MEIHITRDGQVSGPFTLAEVNSHLATNFLKADDLAWHEGLTDWVPLHTVAGVVAVRQSAKPPPPPISSPSKSPTSSVSTGGTSAAPTQNSKTAVASLWCGILGFLLGVPALFGFPLGIYALVAIKRSGGRLTGTGMAIGGIACSAVAFVWFGLVAAIAIPNFVLARTTAQKNACIANLKQIDGAVQQWALETRKLGAATYTLSDPQILMFLKDGTLPTCHAGGSYSAGRDVADSPKCTIPGHSL